MTKTRAEAVALGLTHQTAVRRLRAAGLEIFSATFDDNGVRVTVEDVGATEGVVSTALAGQDPPPTSDETAEADAQRVRQASTDRRLLAALVLRAWLDATIEELWSSPN